MASSFLDIKEILNDYCEEIQENMEEVAKRITKNGKDELKKTSPVNKTNSKTKGEYKKGWVVSTHKSRNSIHCVIHNKKYWQLTHLLENPHSIKNQYGDTGKKTTPQVHITPVDEKCVKEYEQAVHNLIRSTK